MSSRLCAYCKNYEPDTWQGMCFWQVEGHCKEQSHFEPEGRIPLYALIEALKESNDVDATAD